MWRRSFCALACCLTLSWSAVAQEIITPIFVELHQPAPTVVARYEAARRGEAFDDALHRAAVRLAQDQFLQDLIAGGVPYTLTATTVVTEDGGTDIPDRYTDLINAVRLEVSGWDVAEIRRMPEAKHISVDVGLELHLDNSVPYIRANGDDSARSRGIRGSGMVNMNGSSSGQVVAVLDTGIDHTTPMFDTTIPDGSRDALSSDTRPVRLQGSPYVEGLNHPKVGYRFLFSTAPIEGDDTGHGTNVASTAAGLLATDSLGTFAEVEGVAPGAILMDYKVCPSLVCVTAQTLLALEDSVQETDFAGFPKPVATVVNMSFGSDAGDPNSASGTAAGNLQFAGVFPEASAGNAGPDENTINSPSASRRVISTAATNDPGVAPNSIDVLQDDEDLRTTPGPAPDPGTLPKEGTSFLAFFAPESNAGLGFDDPLAQYYVDCGFCDTPDQVAVSVNGRICLAERGSTVDLGVTGSGLFANKATECAAKGGIGLVVFNNAPGQIGVILAPSTIPVFSTSQEAGLHLRDTVGFDAEGISNLPIRLNPPDSSLFVPDTAGFSSRGPNNDFEVVKPDITAPGVEILMGASKIGALGSPTGFASASGTSFSGPHISGVAALLRDELARPEFAPSVLRAAMMNSSTNLREEDGSPISDDDDNNFLHETGAGLVETVLALDLGTVMGTNELNDNGKGGPDDITNPDFLPSYSFGEKGWIGTGNPTQQDAITVTMADASELGGAYSLSVVDAGALRGDVTQPITTPGFSITLGDNAVSVPAGGSAAFDVTVAVDGSVITAPAGTDVNGEEATEFLWYVVATADDETLRMPFFLRIVQGKSDGDGKAPSKATGGGWIADGDGKAHFGFNAHERSMGDRGRLQYDAEESGLRLQGEVTEVMVSSEFEAAFSGTCEADGGTCEACEFQVAVEDNGEPGRGADRFSIAVTCGAAPRHTNDGLLGDGNIKIHKH